MKTSARRALPLALLSLLVASSGIAQETTAGIQGTVKDSSGSAVPNATLELSSPALAGLRRTTSDGEGNYRFASLPAGKYTMNVASTGFRTAKIEILI